MIRQMIVDDISEATELVKATMGDDMAKSYAEGVTPETLDNNYRNVYYDGKVRGTCGVVKSIGSEIAWVGWFAVDPELQGSGIGTQLFKDVIEKLKESPEFRRLYVETYTTPEYAKARRFYSRMGMTPVGFLKDEPYSGCDAVYYGINVEGLALVD